MKIGNRAIGPGHPVFIIAEISANHKQNYKRAQKIIDAACDAGVDAIKLQTYTPDTLTLKSDKKWFKIGKGNSWSGRTLYDLYEEAYTPWDWQPKLKKYAQKRGVLLFSTPFDETAVDFLEKMNVPAHKVASFELPDLELLKKIGQTKKPVIMSRGMASLEEIKTALKTLKANGTKEIALLHCVSAYPADPAEMNLATIQDLAQRFGLVTGLSDHTLGNEVAIAAVALGASIIEKHVTLSRKEGGADAAFSLEPDELKALVKSIRVTSKAIGAPTYETGKKESQNIIFRRSLFAVDDIKKGERLTRENVRAIRPGYGLSPKYLPKVLGKKAKKNISKGTPLTLQHI